MLYRVPELSADDHAVVEAVETMRLELRQHLSRPRRWTGTLRRQSKARAVRGSNSIEGIEVSADTALAIVDGEEDRVAVDRTWLAVKGYSDAMTYSRILAQQHAPIDDAMIRGLHFMVQGYELDRRPGQYRTGEIFVRDDDAGRTVYEGPSPDDVPALMHEYAAELAAMTDRGTPALVQGAMAHLNLVMIHPFADGNGRMARIMQSFMAYREGLAESELVSIEEYLGRNTTAYYDVLATVGHGHWAPDGDASPWLEFVLTAHYRQIRTIKRRIWSLDRVAERIDGLVDAGLVPARSAPALELAMSGWRLRNATYRRLADVTPTVASRDLSGLVSTGVLEKQGEKRGTSYIPAAAHRAWAEQARAHADTLFSPGIDPYRLLRRGETIPTS